MQFHSRSPKHFNSIAHAELVRKDRTIQTLKSQIQKLSYLEPAIISLNNQLIHIESNSSKVIADTEKLQKQFAVKSELAEKRANDILYDIELIEKKIKDNLQKTNRLNGQIRSMKEEFSEERLLQLENHNQQMKESTIKFTVANRAVGDKLKTLKQGKQKIQGQCDMMTQKLDSLVTQTKKLEDELEGLSACSSKARKKLTEQQIEYQRLNVEYVKKSVQNQQLQQSYGLQKAAHKQQSSLFVGRKRLVQLRTQLTAVQGRVRIEIQNNCNLAADIKYLESQINQLDKESQLQLLTSKKLAEQQHRLISKHAQLNDQIEKAKKKEIQLTEVNSALKKKVDNSRQYDAKLRSILIDRTGVQGVNL